MDKKINLGEDLKRHKILLEYDYYVPNEIADEEETLTEQEPEEEEEVGLPAPEEMGGEEIPLEEPIEGDDFAVEDEIEPEMPVDGEVEIDVTDIVANTEETKEKVGEFDQKINDVLTKFGDLEDKLDVMDDMITKIDELETEFEKRNPTPEEKLEMRSLSSFPYNLKLTDYWADKDDHYDVMGDDIETDEPKEYELTPEDIESDYNESEIEGSFEYEEE